MGGVWGDKARRLAVEARHKARKTAKQYEQEAKIISGCLTHPAKRVSRKIYQLRHGILPSWEIYVLHSCDNEFCILDKHHFLGTQKDNIADAKKKGRLRYVTPFKSGKDHPRYTAKGNASKETLKRIKIAAINREKRKRITGRSLAEIEGLDIKALGTV